jgi:D-aspartate ligase
VSVARSLGKAGVRVYALGEAPWDTVAYSRFCASFVDLGSGPGLHASWLEWLESGPRGAVVLPCQDDGLEFIARNRATLLELGYVPMEADDEVVLATLDKTKTYELARRVGVSAPRTVTLESRPDLDAAVEKIGFPCAIKPVHSHLFTRHFGKTKVLIARDRSELELAAERVEPLGLALLLTEIIPGSDSELFSFLAYVDADGEMPVRCVKRKLRQYPPGFGTGCYHVSEWNSEVAEAGERFFRGIGLRGLAYVEFKRDSRDGGLKLIECNHRFGSGLELFRAGGVDLPLLTYNRLLGRPLPPAHCQDGVRLWHPVDDARALVVYRRAKALSFGQWIRSLVHRLHVPIFRWNDPMPTVMGAWVLLKRAGHELARRRASGGSSRTFFDSDGVIVLESLDAPRATRGR